MERAGHCRHDRTRPVQPQTPTGSPTDPGEVVVIIVSQECEETTACYETSLLLRVAILDRYMPGAQDRAPPSFRRAPATGPEPPERYRSTAERKTRQALDDVRGRSETLYTDLIKNKRKRTEIMTDDEEDTQETPSTEATTGPDPQPAQQDYWDIEEDGVTWHGIHVAPRQALYTPTNDDGAPWQNFQDIRRTVNKTS